MSGKDVSFHLLMKCYITLFSLPVDNKYGILTVSKSV